MSAGGRGPSLQRQLLLWLLLPQLVLWLVAAFAAYRVATRHADEATDASLLQAARALARQVRPTASGLFVDLPRSAQDILAADPEDRVMYAVSAPPGQLLLGEARLAALPVTAASAPQFQDAALPERVRVVTLEQRLGGQPEERMRVQVARSSASREQLARRMLLDTALPLSLLIALMSAIVWAGIRAGLAPLAELQARVRAQTAAQGAGRLQPISLQAAPREVHALAGAVNELVAQGQASLELQKRFISDAAHQLRTPLAGLKGQTELALQAAREPELQARLRRVHESALRSVRLVSQLLALARAEPESTSAQGLEPVDLGELMQGLVAEWVPRALAAGADLGLDEVPGVAPLRVLGVGLLLREAVANLIDNALRYAGPEATITVRLRGLGEQVLVEVEDDGPGIPPALRPRVFERFVRGAASGEGCGLGLAIVREIVQRHGGQVALDEDTTVGCRLRVMLPRWVA